MSDFTSQIESVDPPKRRLSGWLWFFIVTCILGCIADLVATILVPSPLNILLTCIIAALRVIVIISVCRLSASALGKVKILLIVFFMVSVLNIFRSYTLSPTEFDPKSLENLGFSGARGLVYTVIWASYFQRSRKVKILFGRNL